MVIKVLCKCGNRIEIKENVLVETNLCPTNGGLVGGTHFFEFLADGECEKCGEKVQIFSKCKMGLGIKDAQAENFDVGFEFEDKEQ